MAQGIILKCKSMGCPFEKRGSETVTVFLLRSLLPLQVSQFGIRIKKYSQFIVGCLIALNDIFYFSTKHLSSTCSLLLPQISV